jgi:hypothetical protein
VEYEPWGRARRRPPSGVEAESEPWGRARRSPSSEVEVESEPWGRARRRPPSGVEAESVFRGRARRGGAQGSGEAEPHPDGWHNSQSRAGGAVFLSGQLVEGRSDCGHFGLVV